GIVPGKRIVIAASGDEAYRTAGDFQAAGIEIARIVDLRLMPNGAMFHIAKSRGQPITVGSAPVAIKGASAKGLSGITIANRLTIDAPALKNAIACDTLLVSGGWAPMPFLAGHLGARLQFDPLIGGFLPDALPAGLFVAGAANGAFALTATIEDGWRAGSQASAHIRGENSAFGAPALDIDISEDDATDAIGALPDISTPAERLKSFVDPR